MLHPFSVNLLVWSERSVRFYSSALISSSRDLLKLEGTFSIFLEKENVGVVSRPAEGTLLLKACTRVLPAILEIII